LRLASLVLFTVAASAYTWADAAVTSRIAALSQQIAQAPGDQALLLERATAYMDSNRADLALADIAAAEAAGAPVNAAFAHGLLLYKTGELAAARPYFDRYLQAWPGDQRTLEYRARLLRDLGETRLALADYEYLIAHDAALDPGYYVAAARLMAALPDRGVDQALALLDARVQQRGPVSALQRYAIELETERGNYRRAIERMAGLDEKLKATPQWQVEVAQLWLSAGHAQEALPYLTVAGEQLQSARPTGVNRELLETVHRLQQQARRALESAGAGGADTVNH